MVLIRPVSESALEGEDVIGIGVRCTVCDCARKIIGRSENAPASLHRQYLQAQVTRHRPRRGSYAFHKRLVMSTPAKVRRTERVKTIDSDAGLSETSRKLHD